jgi:hypothetical protein
MRKRAVIMERSFFMAVILLSACATGVFAERGNREQSASGMRQKDSTRRILDSNERIDLERFDDAQLRELGESILDRIIADPVTRARVSETMGGPDSECLKDMYMMIGYRFLHDRGKPRDSMNQYRFSAGYAFMTSRMRDGRFDTVRHQAGMMPLLGYLMFLFLFISALGSLLFMIRLFRGRI